MWGPDSHQQPKDFLCVLSSGESVFCVRVFLCIIAPWLLGGVAQQQTKLQLQEQQSTRLSLAHTRKLHMAFLVSLLVGYTMRDIRYKWNEGANSVGVSNEVSLPQFKVLGHRQRDMEISLTTGTSQEVLCILLVRSIATARVKFVSQQGDWSGSLSTWAWSSNGWHIPLNSYQYRNL